jgi:hypothetical protein
MHLKTLIVIASMASGLTATALLAQSGSDSSALKRERYLPEYTASGAAEEFP